MFTVSELVNKMIVKMVCMSGELDVYFSHYYLIKITITLLVFSKRLTEALFIAVLKTNEYVIVVCALTESLVFETH